MSAIIPQTIEEVFRIATAISKSGLAPKTMSTPEQITVAILHGAELGLPPMQSIQKIAVVNGRPTLWGDAVPALLWSRGFKLKECFNGTTAICEVVRPNGDVVRRTFSEADAKKAGLWGKAGPWQQFPLRMLAMRARGFAARDGAADVLSGLYLAEEIEDEPAPRRNASQTRKSGDYERFEAAARACTTVDELTACHDGHKAVLATMPESWEDKASEFVATLRDRLTATVLEPEPVDEPLANEVGIIEMIQERFSQCDSEAELTQIKADYVDLIARMSLDGRAKALAILEVPG